MHAGVAVPSAVERKELQQFPVVKEVVICYYTSVDTGHLGASLSEHYRLPHGSIIVGTH